MQSVSLLRLYGLLKKYHHHSNVTACAIEFMKTVEVDLHIRPYRIISAKVEPPRATKSWLCVNEMDRMDCLYRHNGAVEKVLPPLIPLLWRGDD